jgi:cysteine desulfurase
MSEMIYLDHHATTPLDPRVFDAMRPYLTEHFGNPASKHEWGNQAYEAVERARQQVAQLIGARLQEIIFTSGATESNNLVIKHGGWRLVVASRIEHSSVLEAMPQTEYDQRLYLTPQATIDLDWPEMMWQIYQPDPASGLISVMLANNEVGVIHDIKDISRRCLEHGVALHTDASQGLGYIPFNVSEMPGLRYASLSAHKIYGPKGVGALYISELAKELSPAHVGGGHERGLRAGTLNVPGIVGMGRACEIMSQEGKKEAQRLRQLRDGLLAELQRLLSDPALERNGALLKQTLPQTLNVWLKGVNTEQLTLGLSDIAVSTGSACHAHDDQPSHVLRALYPEQPRRWEESLRMAVGRFTTRDMIYHAAKRIAEEVKLL